VGKGDSTNVEVQQTAIQNQETNVNSEITKNLQGSVDGLIDVLKTQAQNPISPLSIPIIINQVPQASAVNDNHTVQNQGLNSLLSLLYLDQLVGQPSSGQTVSTRPNVATIILLAGIVIIAIVYLRRQ